MKKWVILSAAIALCVGFSQAQEKSKPAAAGAAPVGKSTSGPDSVWLDYNPHLATMRETGVNTESCLFCHSSVPDKDHTKSSTLPFLNQKGDLVCESCHGKYPHTGSPEHKAKADPAMVKKIADWKAKNKSRLPLGAAGEVLCVSCHDPHHPKLLSTLDPKQYAEGKVYQRKPPSGSLYLAMKKGMDEKGKGSPALTEGQAIPLNRLELSLRGDPYNGELCTICHDLK